MKWLGKLGADHAVALALVAATLALHAPLLRLDLRRGDEGYLAYGVERVLDGELIYRDFVRTYPPGTYYLFAGLFTVSESDLVTTRVVELAWLALLVALTFWVARGLARRWIAAFTALIPLLLFPPPHKVFVPLCVLLALRICQSLLRPRSQLPSLLLVGAGIGSVAVFRHDVGVYAMAVAALTGAIAAAKLWNAGPNGVLTLWSRLALGAAIVWAPIFAYFAFQGALVVMLEQLLLTGFQTNARLSLPFPSLGGLRGTATASFFYLPGLLSLSGFFAVAILVKRSAWSRKPLLLLQWSLMAVFMHSQVLSRSDWAHLTQVLPGAAPLLAAGVDALATRAREASSSARRRLAGASCAVVLILASVAFASAQQLRMSYAALRDGVALGEPRANMILSSTERAENLEILAALRALAAPGDAIFVAPYAPIFYYLGGYRNPTPYDGLPPGVTDDPEVERALLEALQNPELAALLIWHGAWDGIEDRRIERYWPPTLLESIDRHFVARRVVGSWTVYGRR